MRELFRTGRYRERPLLNLPNDPIRASFQVHQPTKSITAVSPFEFQTVAVLPGLAPERSPASVLLVPLHARAELDVHPGRCGEPKALGHLDQVELVDVKDGPQTMRRISLEV